MWSLKRLKLKLYIFEKSCNFAKLNKIKYNICIENLHTFFITFD